MVIEQDVPLAVHTTFGVGGKARYFVTAAEERDVVEAVRWARSSDLPLFVLGGGSNLLVPDEGFPGLVLRIGILGVRQSEGEFLAGAGEPWDQFVDRTVAANCAGVECLAGIPGTVGGTPVQNVGAYGQEVSETITSVRALDRHQDAIVELDREACRFRYRASVFNTDEPGRYIVTGVRFQLRPGGAPTLRYAELARSFGEPGCEPTLAEVAARVRQIRHAKGMVVVAGDADTQSAGSFFKNPVVAVEQLPRIAAAAGVAPGDVPQWPAGEGRLKLPAAWLLERAGFVKGYGEGAVRISSRHTLALTNRGGATFAHVAEMEREIVAGVEERFGVRLQREPVVLGVEG